MSTGKAVVGIIMGSQSDWPTLKKAAEILDELQVPFETRIVSAHRTPERLYDYAKSAKARGLKVIIAGAGGAAHLPGMTASLTPLPVLGVPIADHGTGRPGQPLFDRADAGRRAGRHAGHRRGGRDQRRPAWRRRSSPSPIRSFCSASRRTARRAPPRSPKSPRMREARR